MKVAILGLGYVGLPLAIAAAESGYEVLGFDVDSQKIEKLAKGISTSIDVTDVDLAIQLNNCNLKVSGDIFDAKNSEVYLICVPTPLSENGSPDLSYLEKGAELVAKVLKKGDLVILESTVAPGTTRSFLIPLLTERSQLKPNEFEVVFSPERIDPKNSVWNVKNTPKILSGVNASGSKRAVEFYSKFIDNVLECESLEVAETAKLLENSFRLVNISFVNELAMFCYKLGIDISHVISAASTKPYGFMPFYPSIGVGGHCIAVDPIYLSKKAMDIGEPIQMIDLAVKINKSIPKHHVIRAETFLKGLKNKKILVVGVSYKPNVADIRESPVESLILELRQKGALVSWHDDLVEKWNSEDSVPLSNQYDLAILATPHDYLDLTKLGDVPILNTRGSI